MRIGKKGSSTPWALWVLSRQHDKHQAIGTSDGDHRLALDHITVQSIRNFIIILSGSHHCVVTDHANMASIMVMMAMGWFILELDEIGKATCVDCTKVSMRIGVLATRGRGRSRRRCR